MSSKEYSSEYYSEYYYSSTGSESESEYEYEYVKPSTTRNAPPPRAANNHQTLRRKQTLQISPSIKGTVDLWENRIAREGPNAIIAPLQPQKSYGGYKLPKRSARSSVCRFKSPRFRRVLPATTTTTYRYYVTDAFCSICNPTTLRIIIKRLKEKWILTLGYLLSILILLSFPECSKRRSYDMRGSKLDWPFETLLLYVWTTDWFTATGTVAINNCTEVYTFPLAALLTFAFGTLILI